MKPFLFVLISISSLMPLAHGKEIKLKIGESVLIGETIVKCGGDSAPRKTSCIVGVQELKPYFNSGNHFLAVSEKRSFISMEAAVDAELLRYSQANCRISNCTKESIEPRWNEGNTVIVKPHNSLFFNENNADEFIQIMRRLDICF